MNKPQEPTTSEPSSVLSWTGFVAIALLSVLAVLLAAPPLENWLKITLTDPARDWLEYGKFFVEIVLVLLFGGAVFSETASNSIESTCQRIESRLNAEHADLAELLAKVERGETVTFDEWMELISSLFPGGISWTGPSISNLKLLVWLATRGMPRGLFGLVAFTLFMAKVVIDVLLLQGSPPTI